MPTPFDTLSADDAVKKIDPPDKDSAKANQAFFDGDHWQDGAAWVGPGSGDQGILPDIAKAFVSKNVIRETAQRHMAGALGNEPNWTFTLRRPLADGEEPTTGEQALIDEAEALLTEWWDKRAAHELLQDATTALALRPRSVLRLFVPRGLLAEGAIEVERGNLSQALDRIYLSLPTYEQAAVVNDDDTQEPLGIYTYQDKDNQKITELAYRDGESTILKVFAKDSETLYSQEYGGSLPLYQMTRTPLITPQARQQQSLLNMALTMLGRNVVLGGFLERIILNAEPPGVWTTDETTGLRAFVPAALRLGAGTTNFLTGASYTDSDGKTQLLNPSVVYRDPVAVNTFLESAEAAYRGILEETRQIHAVQTGAFNISGESRKQARADFAASLLPTKAQLDRAGRWLLETLLAMASAFAGQPGRFAELRASFDCLLDLGPMPADEQAQIISQVQAKMRSKASGMTALGIADPDAELAAIAAEDQQNAEANKARSLADVLSARNLAQDATSVPATQQTNAQTASGLLQEVQGV